MRKKSVAAFFAAGILCVVLTGCGENMIPELTDEQLKDVGEYVAITMMKYDANHRSRLVDLDRLKPTPAPQTTPGPEETPKPSDVGGTADTPVIDSSGEKNHYTMDEVLALPEGVTAVYGGYELCDAYYPSDGEALSMGLPAAEGKKLLVLKFMLNNASGQEQQVDLLSFGAAFQVIVNKDTNKKALFTTLLNDLPTYHGTVAGNTATEVVVVVEIDKETADALNSISLNVRKDEKACTIQLL